MCLHVNGCFLFVSTTALQGKSLLERLRLDCGLLKITFASLTLTLKFFLLPRERKEEGRKEEEMGKKSEAWRMQWDEGVESDESQIIALVQNNQTQTATSKWVLSSLKWLLGILGIYLNDAARVQSIYGNS